jgi:hypothetical protein
MKKIMNKGRNGTNHILINKKKKILLKSQDFKKHCCLQSILATKHIVCN